MAGWICIPALNAHAANYDETRKPRRPEPKQRAWCLLAETGINRLLCGAKWLKVGQGISRRFKASTR
jgi:hypothetical protein